MNDTPPPPQSVLYTDYPLFGMVYKRLESIPMIRCGALLKNIDLLVQRYGGEYLDLVERIISTAESLGWDPVKVIANYEYKISRDNIENRKENKQREDFSEMIEDYTNKRYMEKLYFPGLFMYYGVALGLYSRYNCYKKYFLPKIKSESTGIDIGFGEGFFLWETLRAIPHIKPRGIDISPSSIDIAQSILQSSGYSSYNLEIGNVLDGVDAASSSQDWIIFAGVLTAIPSPEKALSEIVRLLKTGGIAFISTGVKRNSNEIMNNFSDCDSVRNMVASSGFVIQHEEIYNAESDFVYSKYIEYSAVCKKSNA